MANKKGGGHITFEPRAQARGEGHLQGKDPPSLPSSFLQPQGMFHLLNEVNMPQMLGSYLWKQFPC